MPANKEPSHSALLPKKVILDTDIGDDIDDAYALALLASRPEVQLLGVTTAWGQTQERAELAAKLLKVMGKSHIPVYPGRRGDFTIREQYAWAKGYKGRNIKSEEAVKFLKRSIEANPGEITLIAIGPLINIADLLTRHPEVKPKIKQIVLMGGAVYVGYNNQAPPVVEWNIKCSPQSAQIVYQSGVPIVMAGLEVTAMMKFEVDHQKELYAQGMPLSDALAALTYLWGNQIPTQFDAVAVAYVLGKANCESEQKRVAVRDDGMTVLEEGTPNVTLLIKPDKDGFMNWFQEAMNQATISK